MVPFRIVRCLVALGAPAAGLLLMFPQDAWAYIDPGTGSMAYQTLLAAVLGAGFLFRRVWAKTRKWFESFGPR